VTLSADGSIAFIATENRLHALLAADGSEVWTYDLPSAAAHLTIPVCGRANGLSYFGVDDALYVFGAIGTPLRISPLREVPGATISQPLIDDDDILYALQSSTLFTVDADAGGAVSGALTVGGGLTVSTVAAPGTAPVQFTSPVAAPNVQSANLNQYSMYPMSGAVIYQDIFAAMAASAIMKLGSPSYDDTSYPPSNPWNGNHRAIVKFGSNNEQDGNGALVTIPAGFDTVWIRVLGDRWNAVHAYAFERTAELGLWVGGNRQGNSYCPDGSLSDGTNTTHEWLPIHVGFSGRIALISKPNTDKEFWLSGLAFTANRWAHAAQSAVAFVWGLNGGDQINWEGVWGSDVDCSVSPQTTSRLMVPLVNSGRDKLLYVVGENNDPNRLAHDGVLVNGVNVGRLRASFDNPFARHWNSKMYERYAAVIIPARMITASGFWTVQIDMGHQSDNFKFREIGTHDLEVPISR